MLVKILAQVHNTHKTELIHMLQKKIQNAKHNAFDSISYTFPPQKIPSEKSIAHSYY